MKNPAVNPGDQVAILLKEIESKKYFLDHSVLPTLDSLGHMKVRLLNDSDAHEVQALRTKVLSTLEHPDHYRPELEAANFVDNHLKLNTGIMVGLTDRGSLVSYCTLTLINDRHPAWQALARSTQESHQAIAFYSSAMVIPQYRGRGLHHAMIRLRHALCEHLGLINRIATISPENWRSWENFSMNSMPLCAVVEYENGAKRLVAKYETDMKTFGLCQEEKIVDLQDHNVLKELFLKGMHLVECRVINGREFGVFVQSGHPQ